MSQVSLFEQNPSWEKIDVKDADVKIMRSFLQAHESFDFFSMLLRVVPWWQGKITVYGQEHLVPRMHCWFGDKDKPYTYSGMKLTPEPWTEGLWYLKQKVEKATGCAFNSMLANLYRNGEDTVGWHSDDEPELGPNPTIASLSLGQSRDFLMRHKKTGDSKKIELEHGSLLLMSGSTQEAWQHSIPRRKCAIGSRVNLTFRTIVTT